MLQLISFGDNLAKFQYCNRLNQLVFIKIFKEMGWKVAIEFQIVGEKLSF